MTGKSPFDFRLKEWKGPGIKDEGGSLHTESPGVQCFGRLGFVGDTRCQSMESPPGVVAVETEGTDVDGS